MTTYDHHDTEDPMVILLGFVAAAGFGSGVPLLGMIGLLACAGHITAKIDPESLPARLITSGQGHAHRLTSAAREHMPALPAYDEPQNDHGDIFDLLISERHALIVGHTGGGKSTLLHALATRFGAARANVLAIDVDSVAGRYPGYRVVGSGDDYHAAHAGLILVKRELQRRRAARKEGVRDFPRMVLLIDEVQDVVRELEEAWPIIEDVIRRGRKVNVWAVIAAQDSQVKTLNLQGKSHLLGNMIRVDVQRRNGQRVADTGGNVYSIPKLRTPDELVQTNSAKPAKPVSKPVSRDGGLPDETTLLNQLLEGGFKQFDGVNHQNAKPVSHDNPETTLNQFAILAAYERLGSKNKVWEWLRDEHGIRNKNRAYQLISAALDRRNDDDPPPAFGWLAE
jgi:energy-coupling factor transporter ATP-binding protein EcfA2